MVWICFTNPVEGLCWGINEKIGHELRVGDGYIGFIYYSLYSCIYLKFFIT